MNHLSLCVMDVNDDRIDFEQRINEKSKMKIYITMKRKNQNRKKESSMLQQKK